MQLPWPHRLFPDFDSAEDAAGIAWERLLEDGTRADLTAWLDEMGEAGLVSWLRTGGDRLSARSYAFWRWLLQPQAALPEREVNPWWPDAEGRRS